MKKRLRKKHALPRRRNVACGVSARFFEDFVRCADLSDNREDDLTRAKIMGFGNGVMVGAGAKVLGPVTVGDNAKIAAGAVVLKDIPADGTAVGIPARVARVRGKRVASDLDQVHIPDPVQQELLSLSHSVTALQKEVAALTEKSAAKKAPRKSAATVKKEGE